MKFLRFTPKHSHIGLDADEAGRLTRRFLDGETDLAEEKLLYAYYSSPHVDQSLKRYCDMFAWYESLQPKDEKQDIRPVSGRIIAAAASIAVVVLAGIGIVVNYNSHDAPSYAESIYAGSYIIRDGKKITDIDAILPELQRAERLVDSTLIAVSSYDSANPELAVLENVLNAIPDPDVQEMLRSDMAY